MKKVPHYYIQIDSSVSKQTNMSFDESNKLDDKYNYEMDLFQTIHGKITAEHTEYLPDDEDCDCESESETESDLEIGEFEGHLFPAYEFDYDIFNAHSSTMEIMGRAVDEYMKLDDLFTEIVILDKIEIKKDFRGYGLFEAVLNHIQKICRSGSARLFLIPYPLQHAQKDNEKSEEFKKDYINLVEFYASFGFEFIDESINVMVLNLENVIRKRAVPPVDPKLLPLFSRKKKKKRSSFAFNLD